MSDLCERCSCGHAADTHYPDTGSCAWCGCLKFRPDANALPKPYMGVKAPGAEDGRYLYGGFGFGSFGGER